MNQIGHEVWVTYPSSTTPTPLHRPHPCLLRILTRYSLNVQRYYAQGEVFGTRKLIRLMYRVLHGASNNGSTLGSRWPCS